MDFLLFLQKTAPATQLAMSAVSKTPPTKLAAAAPAAMSTSTQPLTAGEKVEYTQIMHEMQSKYDFFRLVVKL